MLYPPARPLGTIVTLRTVLESLRTKPTIACPASWYATRFPSSGEITVSFLAGPAITRSSASSISDAVISVLLRRAATKAASFKTFSRSAPTKPGVWRATSFKSTSGAKGLFLA